MRNHIIQAIDFIKEASKAVGKNPIIVLYPVAQAFCSFGFLIVWAIIMIYLTVSEDMVPQCICPSSADVSEILKRTTVWTMKMLFVSQTVFFLKYLNIQQIRNMLGCTCSSFVHRNLL